MGRAPCCDKANVKRGPWSPDEDATLKNYLHKYGTGGNWISLPQRAGLKRCGKSCRLRWLNYLRPDIKHGSFTEDEDNTIISLYSKMGSRWSVIAANLPGRTDNDVKNHWNTKLKKKLFGGCNNNNNNNKSNSLITPKIANLFPNDTTNPTIIIQQQPSSSTPTPSSSTPSPNYVVNHPNYHNQAVNHHNYHQFYTPLPSFSSLLSQCTNNNTPMSLTSNFNSLTSFDHIYANADQVCSSVSSCQTPLKQEVVMPNYSCSVGPIANLCSNEEVSSMSELSTNLYGSSLEGDHQLLDVLGFGFAQDVLVTSNCNYGGDGDQVDIKPQGLGQDLTN